MSTLPSVVFLPLLLLGLESDDAHGDWDDVCVFSRRQVAISGEDSLLSIPHISFKQVPSELEVNAVVVWDHVEVAPSDVLR